MKTCFKTACIALVLCVSQVAYSQLLYPQKPEKDSYVPPYDPNVVIISPDVQKWMDEQLTKPAEKKTVEMNWDIRGRVKSADEAAQKELKVVDNKQKRLVRVSDMHIQENPIETEHGRYEYNSETKEKKYSLKGEKTSEKEYSKFLDNKLEKFKKEKRGKRDLLVPGVVSSDDRSWTAWLTSDEISELTEKYKELVISDYKEPIANASVASILSSIQLSTLAHNNGYKGNGINVYVMEPGCRDTSVPIVNSSKYTNNCSGTVDNHHSMTVNVVQYAAPLAHVSGFKASSTLPLSGYDIGTHSYCFSPGDRFYSDNDANMDNHIYENKVINFVAAGNQGKCNSTLDISSPGKALNAITVGAVEPATNRYASYSRWKNALLRDNFSMFYNQTFDGSDKPEIAMYTDIEMGSYSLNRPFDGTSAATPLAAGFTASLLEQHPFFKRQPALMKAVLLTGETIPIQNANSWDTDSYSSPHNVGVARGITNYSSVARWKSRSAYWNGANSAYFDSKNEIKFTENNIQANTRYRIAISWLVPGDFVYQFGRLPQDIDLYVLQNNTIIAYSNSTKNNFEVVDFTTKSNAPITIAIHRYSNTGGGNVHIGYHMRENL